MCQPFKNNSKSLTKKDFYNAFFQSEIKDTQGRVPIRELMFGESMQIAAEIAYELYKQSVLINTDGLICLTDRQDEFQAALTRGFDQDFEVFEAWETDCFYVVNKTQKTEYLVELKTIDEKLYASCGCQDFLFRHRACKHISQVLLARMFGGIRTKETPNLPNCSFKLAHNGYCEEIGAEVTV